MLSKCCSFYRNGGYTVDTQEICWNFGCWISFCGILLGKFVTLLRKKKPMWFMSYIDFARECKYIYIYIFIDAHILYLYHIYTYIYVYVIHTIRSGYYMLYSIYIYILYVCYIRMQNYTPNLRPKMRLNVPSSCWRTRATCCPLRNQVFWAVQTWVGKDGFRMF